MDVGHRAEPRFEGPRFVADWVPPREKPAVLPVVTPIARFDLELRAHPQGFHPLRNDRFPLVGVDRLRDSTADENPAIAEPLVADESDAAIRGRDPDDAGELVDEGAQATLAR